MEKTDGINSSWINMRKRSCFLETLPTLISQADVYARAVEKYTSRQKSKQKQNHQTTGGFLFLEFFDVRAAAFVLDMLKPFPHAKDGYIIFQIEVGFHILDIRIGEQILQDGNHKGRQP